MMALSLSQAAPLPGVASERIYLNYSLFGRSISTQSLETFAKEGKLSDELVSYSRFFKPQQLAQLRQGLQQKVEFPTLAVSQFLYSPLGEIFLQRGSQLIQTPTKGGSFYALRSALILASNDPEGITALSILRHYPSPSAVLNLAEVIGVVNDINRALKATTAVTQAIQSTATGQTLPPEQVAQLLPLKRPGSVKWEKISFELQDKSAKRLRYTRKVRNFPIDVYLPSTAQSQPQPVIIISHGLNSDRHSYAYLAEHLASHGYGVIVPEHPGSNKQQLKALFEGNDSELSAPIEFLDRPLDIQFALDAIQKLSAEDPRFSGRLDLKNVGIIGQSFGGYTALASAGAPLNFAQLRKDCRSQLNTTLDISLVLQCQVLRLPPASYQLSDPRIKAAIAINPLTSSIFGAAGMAQIKVPTLIMAGTADVIAPALAEQIQPFSALTTPQRYLALVQNGTHFSTIARSKESSSSLENLKGIEGPTPDLAQSYLKTLSLVFAQAYLKGQTQDRAFLSPGGAAALSQSTLPLSIVTSVPTQDEVPKEVPKEAPKKTPKDDTAK
jgi:predicted dienelactone hydrolase